MSLEHLPQSIRMVRRTHVVLPARLAGVVHGIWLSQGHHWQGGPVCDQWTGMPVPPASSLVILVWIGTLEKVLGTETNWIDPRTARHVRWSIDVRCLSFHAWLVKIKNHDFQSFSQRTCPTHSPALVSLKTRSNIVMVSFNAMLWNFGQFPTISIEYDLRIAQWSHHATQPGQKLIGVWRIAVQGQAHAERGKHLCCRAFLGHASFKDLRRQGGIRL